MDKHKIADKTFCTVGDIVKKSDFLATGLKDQDVYLLLRQGYIERVRNGYYRMSSTNDTQEESMLSRLMTHGILCMESALFYYGYSDFTPRKWTMAIPRNFSRTVKAIEKTIPIKAYYVRNHVYHLGETTGVFNGVILPVYDRERTICDCFKYRTKLDKEIFTKALHAYVKDPQKNLMNLTEYAKEMGIYKSMINLMEVLLNG